MRSLGSVAAILVLLVAGTVYAEQIVEIDLDGVQGNGPDTAWVSVGDTISADVWILGDLCLSSLGTEVCNPGGALEFQSFSYKMTGWTNAPPYSEDPYCWIFQSTTFNFDCEWEPFRFGIAKYVAATENTIAPLSVDVEDSGWFSYGFQTGMFDDYVGAVVRIGEVGVEPASWGSIKTLFR